MRLGIGLGIGVSGAGGTVDLTQVIGRFNFDVANVTRPNTPTNENVSQVNDLSGNARHLTQSTDGNRPVWTDASPDYGVVNTGGSTIKRLLRTGMGATFSHYEWTVALVCQIDTAPSLNNLHAVSIVSNSATGRGGLSIGYFSTTQTRRVSCTRISDGTVRNYDFGTASLGVKELIVVRVAGPSNGGDAVVTARVNGVTIAGSGSMFSNNVDANAMFQLGCSITTGASRVWHDERWNRALNDASIASLEATLAAQYGIAI